MLVFPGGPDGPEPEPAVELTLDSPESPWTRPRTTSSARSWPQATRTGTATPTSPRA
ncbi:hypothetical protein ACFQXA_35650 [Nocardiopsis composta]